MCESTLLFYLFLELALHNISSLCSVLSPQKTCPDRPIRGRGLTCIFLLSQLYLFWVIYYLMSENKCLKYFIQFYNYLQPVCNSSIITPLGLFKYLGNSNSLHIYVWINDTSFKMSSKESYQMYFTNLNIFYSWLTASSLPLYLEH